MVRKLFVVLTLCLLMTGTLAFADWNPGDPYKMHYPQLPDLNGWDIYAEAPTVVADDWRCTDTGPITSIHFWGSWKSFSGPPFQISNIHVGIYSNDPVGPLGHSVPDFELWSRDFGPSQFVLSDPVEVLPPFQGWFDPTQDPDLVIPGDHNEYHQINIVGIADPYVQIKDTIYWLAISVTAPGGTWGWKTSGSPQFMDDAVWWDGTDWQELSDPISAESLDMAFVITPIPGAVWVLGSLLLGFFGLGKRRKWLQG